MAKDLYDRFDEVRESYAAAAEILGFDLAKICFTGPEDDLRQTKVTQPAIFVHSAVLVDFLYPKKLIPDVAAGHSLGEYSALYAAGALTFEEALRLVKVRAELMQRAGEINAGSMAAILGLDADVLQTVCEKAQSAGIVQIANYNSPNQIVISGSVAGVDRAMAIAKEKGAKRVVPLVVSGAFHSPLMEFGRQGLEKALAEVEIKQARVPVYTNVTAKPVTQPTEIKRLLIQQLTSPVRWVETIENMIEDGVEGFYEIGPGAVLTGLMKRINKNVTANTINNLESLESV